MFDRLLRRLYKPYRDAVKQAEEALSLRKFVNVEMMDSLKRQHRYLELLNQTVDKLDEKEKNRDYYATCLKRLREIYDRDCKKTACLGEAL